ncbi:hypothetical protein BGZ96_011452 [Linnemannia gamsii]|uniref:Uncharacterized protein n=1 Tax=Linnemannia gamsii TaxID=64522 RepID=A0ABQ7JSX9_9FUNG|nr:hypothetical protein BGZ96_011452 [Linnemannia gamsii]
MQPRRPTVAAAALSSAVHDFPPLESGIEIPSPSTLEPKAFSDPAAETSAEVDIGTETQIEANENESETTTVQPNQIHSWKVASERIVIGVIQCLTETKDMELSYVSLLSAITVLNSRLDYEGVNDGEVGVPSVAPVEAIETDDPVGKLYAQLLSIMTRPVVAEGLTKETLRQGDLSPDTLYIRLYKAILNAGYHLQDEEHVCLAQFLLSCQNTEDALFCLAKVDSTQWTSHIYRLAISCHLFTKPRHLHEAEILLDQYLAHNKSLSSSPSSSSPSTASSNRARPKRGSRSSSDTEREQFKKSLIQTWFKQQLDESKWDEIKAQYERRRARLLDAPSNIEKFSASMFDKNCLSSGNEGLSGHRNEGSTVSRASVVADHGHVASDSAESLAAPVTGTTASNTAATPVTSEPLPAAVALPKRLSFSLFSAFRSSKPTTTTPVVPIIQTRATNDMSKQSAPTSASVTQVNRHLTILDNGMLEECVNHKQFEYGWSIYECMGPLLEDKDTAKIAMRLCKRAFLGHGGLGPNLPGSPNVLAKDVYFEDEVAAGSVSTEQSNARTGTGSGSERIKGEEDPEVWEARAWVIYNKAMMSPFFLNSTGSPSNSPTQTQCPGVTAAIASSASATGVNRGNGSLTSPLSSMAGTTALTVFLHNILTVAINSQEQSSRYLKAFRIYSTMRNDPLNQYQSQLRDPFVMTCMIKVIYDTVLILVRAQDRQRQQQQQQQSSSPTTAQARRASVSSLAPSQQPTQQMTIGPLIDLAFEIYADMRNVGPIRHLPRLSALAPPTPISKTPQSSTVTPGVSGGSSMSVFFQLSSRAPASTSTVVDLSACGVTAPSNESSSTVATSATTPATKNSGSSIIGPFSTPTTSSTLSFPCTLQDLNPTLIQSHTLVARRLPTELYLALLHLCIQVPLSGVGVSSQVVKTIVADMVSSRPGQQPANLDRHLAAALQVFHDRWMCRAVELKGRRKCLSRSGGGSVQGLSRCNEGGEKEEGELEEVDLETMDDEQDNSDGEAEVEEGGCIFHGWMYRPEEYVLKHMASSSSSSSSSSSNLASNPYNTNNNTTTTIETDELSSPSSEEQDSPLEVSKYDADLDELDRYLDEKKIGLSDGSSTEKRGESDGVNSWMEGLDHDTSNERFYWNMWSREDQVLQEIQFSRRRARMLWRHVAEL